jgi:hypothetical protein
LRISYCGILQHFAWKRTVEAGRSRARLERQDERWIAPALKEKQERYEGVLASLWGYRQPHVPATGKSSSTFLLAFLIIVVWAVTSPVFGFSDTRQLMVHTATTIETFLMVFLIQNSQNRDGVAI